MSNVYVVEEISGFFKGLNRTVAHFVNALHNCCSKLLQFSCQIKNIKTTSGVSYNPFVCTTFAPVQNKFWTLCSKVRVLSSRLCGVQALGGWFQLPLMD